MVRASALCVGLLATAFGVGCGARSELEALPLAGRGGAEQGGATQGGAGGSHDDRGGASANGGAGANGGTGGHAGAMPMGGAAGSPDTCPLLIDDMEDDTGRIPPCKGRVGAWYAYNDGFGLEFPAVTPPNVPILPTLINGGRGASKRAMFASYEVRNPPVVYNPPVNWGAGIGVDLSFDGTHYGVYDASAYDGITFWARSSIFGGTVEVRVSTAATTLTGYGGTCPKEFCAPAQGGFVVTTNWTRHSFKFTDLRRPPGEPAMDIPFSKDQLTNIQFLFTLSDYKSDIRLDDLAFFVDPK